MANCDFCGNETSVQDNCNKKDARLNKGNYCDKCKNKEINDLFEEILNEENLNEEDI